MAIDTNLVAYWDTSNTSSQAGVWPVSFVGSMAVGVGQGKFADAWVSSSTADYADVTTTTTNNTNWTISAWAFNLGSSGYRALSTNGLSGVTGAYHLLVSTGTNELGVWSNSTFYGSGTILDPASYSGWHHYASTFDGTTVRFYVDGVAAGTAVPVWAGTTGVDTIGGSTFGEGFGDRVCDFGVWGRQLSAIEIAEIYTEGEAGNSLGDLLPGPTDLRNLFGTVVHDVPEGTTPIELRSTFGTVVHDVPEGTTPIELRQLFSTVVHDVVPIPGGIPCIQPEESDVQNYFGSGFVINNYLNLSGGRKRRVDQVPFKLGIRDKLGLRLDDTISTPPGDDPTDCD